MSTGPNSAYLGLFSEPSRLITSKDNPIIYEENGTVPPFEGFTANDSKLLEGHPASYFATADHAHSQYASIDHTHTMEQLTGILPISKGGTGVSTLNELKSTLGVTSVMTQGFKFSNTSYTTLNISLPVSAQYMETSYISNGVVQNTATIMRSIYTDSTIKDNVFGTAGVLIYSYYVTGDRPGSTYLYVILSNNGNKLWYYIQTGGAYSQSVPPSISFKIYY